MQKAVGAESFDVLLNEGHNDNPEYFYTTYECKMLGDKVTQLESEEDDDCHKMHFEFHITRGERRRRARVHKNHLKRLNDTCSGCPSGTREKELYNGNIIVVRSWRGQRSKHIKKDCNRKFRRNSKLNMLVSRSRNIQHKVTEFWWEYS